jgi:hypothetical protein
MNNEEMPPSVEEIKERLKVDIPVEEEVSKTDVQQEAVDVSAEFKQLGRQFAETIKAAWYSEERHRIETEIREGVKSFVDEVDKVIREAKDSPAIERVKDEAVQVKTKVETTDIARKARGGMAQGLQWLSEELAKLSQQFTPTEKGTDTTAEEEESVGL